MSAPAGTVTFLFTDIEGSTRLWQDHPAAMPAALERHHAILRQAIESSNGYVFQIIGDAFCAAFHTASDGLAATLAAQRALQAEPWRETGPIRVRMALHTGPAEIDPSKQVSGQYASGLTLSHVARLVSAGHGGQILLGEATHEPIRDCLPAGVTLRDMGLRRLKDLIRPEHIFQIVAPDLPAEFPPLRTLDARRNNLPTQATPFIGREKEMAECLAMVRRPDVRLLTLMGIGGTGKTRLALQMAADLIDDFDHGVFFVDLSALRDPGLVASAIATTLGVQPAEKQPLLDALVDYLRQKQMLLVLDNFEQVVEAAPLAAQILQTAPGLKVLVTSRVALRVTAEHEYAVPPLRLPDVRHLPALPGLSQYEAVALFIERSQAVQPDFQVTNANAPAVAEICVRLDGLPLAIELAAARSKILTPQGMLPRLSHRLSVLTAGARDLPGRHRTLRAAIDWSYELLPPQEQRLFRWLAVFAGGWTLQAAEAVCGEAPLPPNSGGTMAASPRVGGQGAILDLLTALVDSSLVRRQEQADGGIRFSMLETIREYAWEKLEASGEAETLCAAHARFFLAFAEDAEPKLHGPEQKRWLDLMQTEHDNVRAVLKWAIGRGEAQVGLRLATALREFWVRRDHWQEAWTWFQLLLALPSAAGRTALRARALCFACVFADRNRQREEATRLGNESISIARELGDKQLLAQALFHGTRVEGASLEPRRAVLQESLALFREINDDWGITFPLLDLYGIAGDSDNDPIAARALIDEAIGYARASGDKRRLAMYLAYRAMANARSSDEEATRAQLREALALAEELEDKTARGTALIALGRIAPTAERVKLMDESLALAREFGTPVDIIGRSGEAAEARIWSGDYGGAETLIQEAITLERETGTDAGDSFVLNYAGLLELMRGAPEQALVPLRESLALSLAHRNVGGSWSLLYAVAYLAIQAAAVGQWQRAARLLGATEAYLAKAGRAVERPEFLALLDQSRAAAQEHLTEDDFARAWAEGQAMTIEQAGQHAMKEEE